MMHSLGRVASGQKKSAESLSELDRLSVNYHNLFDFPLTFAELIKWQPSKHLLLKKHKDSVIYQSGYYFLEGKTGLVYKRSLRERTSVKKMEIAKKAANILGFIPSVKMVAVTGSLAIGNAGDESDIDLMIITQRGTLWTTRLLTYFALRIMNYAIRKPRDNYQKDKLCLNMWMDEADLAWRKGDRNIYTAHEIAQILPLVNKDNTYEKFLFKNKWILDYWPSAVAIKNLQYVTSGAVKIENSRVGENLLEKIAYKLQYLHMKKNITREIITPTRAIFHPQDWGKVIVERLAS